VTDKIQSFIPKLPPDMQKAHEEWKAGRLKRSLEVPFGDGEEPSFFMGRFTGAIKGITAVEPTQGEKLGFTDSMVDTLFALGDHGLGDVFVDSTVADRDIRDIATLIQKLLDTPG